MGGEPLAARMRPKSLDEVVGQAQLLGSGAPLRALLDQRRLPSLLLWGPPGCGKTTISRLLAEAVGLELRSISAVTGGIQELRDALPGGRGALFASPGRGVLLFVDEIHRWNKAQQDALLPHVESGAVTLVGATTENPAFEVIPALRSRCWLLVLEPLGAEAIAGLLRRALSDPRGIPGVAAEEEALQAIAQAAQGDARLALSLLERAAVRAGKVDREALEGLLSARDLHHDADGDAHHDVVSAFIKSLRGSDPDAALYWMARMLEGGEDPRFIARRMVIFASEDIGNAEPRALPLAVSALAGVTQIGMPEGRILLGQCCTFLATSPKSNASYKGIDAALQLVRRHGALAVPLHLRNAPTALARALGHAADYRYPHDHPDHIVAQDYLPPELKGTRLYEPTGQGAEKTIRERLEWWRRRLGGTLS